MMMNRQLNWDGCNNVRDLGGLSTVNGQKTRWGAVVRSDHPSKLTPSGWSALYEHGIRTIITLQTDGVVEDTLENGSYPSDLTVVHAAIEDMSDTEFVQQWVNTNFWGTPLYYYDALMRWPERHIRVLKTLAEAKPGGVLFHCGRGYDRTGIIALLLLGFVGVAPDEIIQDYEMSLDPFRDELLKERNTSTREVFLDTLARLDFDGYLLAGGLSRSDMEAIRERFLEPVEMKIAA